jgi:hypothetical protein
MMVRSPRNAYITSRRGKHIAKDLAAGLEREEVEERSRHSVVAAMKDCR